MKNQNNYLILGGTGSLGYAFTQELINQQIHVTLLVRNKSKAISLFGNSTYINIIEGDVLDLDIVKQAAIGKNIIFHGINYPFTLWQKYMPSVTANVIEAAKTSKATIIFPGNIYAFGNLKQPIREDTVAKPNTKKGKLRAKLETMLYEASKNHLCKTIIIRLPDSWGPNVTNKLIAPIFENVIKNKAMPWLLNADIPHQMVFTVDAARIIKKVIDISNDFSGFTVLNYGGTTFPSIKSWLEQIAQENGSKFKVSVAPKLVMSLLALFIPIVRELKENFYQFENSIVLDDKKIKSLIPDFQPTPLNDAISQTLIWFKKNQQ